MDDIVEVITFEINRDSVVPQMINLYKDEQITSKAIKVVFDGEVGLDYGGLSKELFTKFWKESRMEYFRSESVIVPFISLAKIRKGLSEDFVILGRILMHTLLITKSLPTQFAKSFYLMLGDLDKKIPGMNYIKKLLFVFYMLFAENVYMMISYFLSQ